MEGDRLEQSADIRDYIYDLIEGATDWLITRMKF